MKRLINLAALTVFAGVVLSAQDLRGTIRGIVRDASSAVVPAVEVHVINTATNVKNTAVTSESGYYNVEFLVPGSYKIEVAAKGFKKLTREGLDLAARQILAIDLSLEVGGVSESVTVKAESPLLETSNASSGMTIDNKRLLDLPMFGNNIGMSVLLAPGVANDQNYFLPGSADRNSYAVRVGGGGFTTSEYTLDGFSTAIAMNRVAFIPPVYAVNEMRVDTNAFDATTGGGTGGNFSAPTKSGTNEYHGNIWEHMRQNRWNALSWTSIYNFNKQVVAGQALASNRYKLMATGRYNDFGFTMGGPVTLPYWSDGPKLLKMKDKLFFFFSGNGQVGRGGGGRTYRMPTELERKGDFSEILARGGANYQLFDPGTGTLVNGTVVRQPFADNKIPANRISPIATWYSQFYPLPNAPGLTDLGQNFFNPTVASGSDYYSYMARGDYRINDKNNLFVRWFSAPYDDLPVDFTGQARFSAAGFKRNNGWLASHVYSLNPNTVFSFQGGLANNKTGNLGTAAEDPTIAGLPGYLKETAGDRLHLFGVTFGGTNAVPGFETGPDSYTTYTAYSGSAQVSHTRSSHTLRAGYEYHLWRYYDNRPGRPAGGVDFNGSYVRPANGSNQGSNTSYAQFLLGLPSGGSIDVNPAIYDYRDRGHFLYFQDDWRVNRRLTVNFGMRYELLLPISVVDNLNTQGFDPTAKTPISDQAEAAYAAAYAAGSYPGMLTPDQFKVRGVVTWLGVNGAPTTMYHPDKNNFSPRVGFAYQLNNRFVLRGGFGSFFENAIGTQSSENFPRYWNQSTGITATPDGVIFKSTLADPFPVQANGQRFITAAGNSLGSSAVLGNGYSYFSVNNKVAQVSHRFHMELQANLLKEWVFTAGWTSGLLKDVGIDRNLDELPQQYWSTNLTSRDDAYQTYINQQVPNPFKGLVPLNSSLNTANTVSRSFLLRPYPQFNGSLTERNNLLGSGRYDEFTFSAQKRYSSGFTMQLSGTGSKTFTPKIYQAYQTTPIRILADWTHRIAANGVYDIPFGKGRRFGSQMPWPVQLLAGGWQMGAIYQYQIRGPLKFGTKYFFNGDYNNVRLPDLTADWSRQFNTAAGFERSASKTPQGIQPWAVPEVIDPKIPNGQALNNWDASLGKAYYFTEARYLKFKFEMYNALNHYTFTGPDVNPANATFGSSAPGVVNPARTLMLGLQFFF